MRLFLLLSAHTQSCIHSSSSKTTLRWRVFLFRFKIEFKRLGLTIAAKKAIVTAYFNPLAIIIMQSKKYQFTAHFREEEGVIIATVPALRGCVSYGKTLAEAEKNIREAIECHVEGMLEDGEMIPIERQPVTLAVNKALTVSVSPA